MSANDAALASAVARISSELKAAVDRFAADSRLADLATQEVPGARVRLEHVLKLTDEAAHRTLELVEKSIPLVDELQRPAGSAAATLNQGAVEQLRNHLTEVLLAQGYQDLSGQIIRNVIVLVDEIETVLRELVALTQGATAGSSIARQSRPRADIAGHGPAVPGLAPPSAVAGQDDVDSLLSGMGL